MEEKEVKICPLLSVATKYREEICLKERCAWWNEDRQKCSVAVVPPRK